MCGRPARRTVVFATLLLAAWAAPSWATSHDEMDRGDETRRWVPAAGVTWGMFGQDADASVMSSPLSTNPSEPVRPPASGSATLLAPAVGGTFELMTPRVLEGFGRPRAFARLDVTAALGFSFDVAKEGDPGALDPPAFPTIEPEIAGQGSVTEAQAESPILTFGAGLAFTVDAGSWRFRIRPSFEYIREDILVSGTVNRAVRVTPPPPPLTTDFRLIQLSGSATQTYHGIGPGIEIELDAGRIDPFTLSVFIGGQAYALMGDRDVAFGDTYTDSFGTESAEWRFRSDEWLVRGSMGLRLRWLPK